MVRLESASSIMSQTSAPSVPSYPTPTKSLPLERLPVMSINHISFAVPLPQLTANFFHKVLGFRILKRPVSFESFDGAWICGMGLEIHFIAVPHDRDINLPNRRQALGQDRLQNLEHDKEIDPRNDHLSFLCTDTEVDSPYQIVKRTLSNNDVRYVEREFPKDDLRQVRLSSSSPSVVNHLAHRGIMLTFLSNIFCLVKSCSSASHRVASWLRLAPILSVNELFRKFHSGIDLSTKWWWYHFGIFEIFVRTSDHFRNSWSIAMAIVC